MFFKNYKSFGTSNTSSSRETKVALYEIIGSLIYCANIVIEINNQLIQVEYI